MSGKTQKQKGTFSEINLRLSKKYLPPASQRRMWLIGGGAGIVLILFIFINYFYQNASFASKGPLSSGHARLQSDCEACHTSFRSVANEKCSVCHEKYGDKLGVYTFSAHYLYRSNDFRRVESKEGEVPCFACHIEHAGRGAELKSVSDYACVTCHRFGSFNKKHPQFDFMAEKQEDASGLRFTHIRHVREVEKRQKLVDIEKACLHCHNPQPDGKNFEPIDFNRHCDVCHLTRTTGTPRLPVRNRNVIGVETLQSIQERRPPGTRWAFYTNPNEFRVSGGKIAF